MPNTRLRSLFRLVRNPVLLAAINGAILSALLFLRTSDTYETQLYRMIVRHSIDGAGTQRDSVLRLLHATHALVSVRQNLLDPRQGEMRGLKARFMMSADNQFTGSDACGAYSVVLARLLQETNTPTRIAQMRCDKQWGCHIFVEAKVDGRWAALDPSYDLAFERPDGRLASAAEVGRDWASYKAQVPSNYEMRYAYEGVRYTNWGKIPVIMPVVRWIAKHAGVANVDEVSVRTHVIAVYRTYMYLLLIPYLLVLVWTVASIREAWQARGSRVLPAPSRRLPTQQDVELARGVVTGPQRQRSPSRQHATIE